MKPIQFIAFATLQVLALALSARADNPLPSWNDGAAKQDDLSFSFIAAFSERVEASAERPV
jgi:hypothetical protein